jgi:hypothetical protein
MAPSRLAARVASMNSGRLSIRIITRSPKPIPRRCSAPANEATLPARPAQVMVRPSNRSAVAAGCISA